MIRASERTEDYSLDVHIDWNCLLELSVPPPKGNLEGERNVQGTEESGGLATEVVLKDYETGERRRESTEGEHGQNFGK